LFEPAIDVDAVVAAGEVAGTIWPLDDLGRERVELRFTLGGRVLARRTTPIVSRGDYVCHVGVPISDDDFRGMR
jgi:predicted deacylase